MTMTVPAKIGCWVLRISPIVIVAVVIFASAPWLKQQSNAVAMGIAAAGSIFVMGYALFIAARITRRMDEVEIAGQRFAHTKGMTIGWVAAVLVMLFPPAMNALVELVQDMSAGSPAKAAKLGITVGFMLLVFLQALSLAAVSFWWGRRLGRPE